MTRIPGRAAIALIHAISAAFIVSPRDAHAQSRSGDRGPSPAALGAAIAEAQRSPFYRVDPNGSGIAPRTGRVAIMPPPAGERWVMLQKAGQEAATDEASISKVFFWTAVAAHLSDFAGLYLLLEGGHRPRPDKEGDLMVMSAPVVAVSGPVLAARTLGKEFGTALLGSLLGAVLGVISMAAVEQSGMPWLLAISLGAFVHAGTVTWTTAW
ncbi:MAG: hypothetical protein J4F34_01245 [Gemmatimonadetes bacterium]|nr:hypothetical protein [Gemmatimonadota bacterium]